MKSLLTIPVILISITFSFCQNSAYPKTPYFDLFDIIVEGDNILSAGYCNQALFSRDGGATLESFPISTSFNQMAAVPGSNGTQAYLMDNGEVYILDSETQTVTSSGIDTGNALSGTFKDILTIGNDIVIIGSISIVKADASALSWENLGEFEYGSNDNIGNASATNNFIYTSTRQGKIFKTDLTTKTTELVFDFEESIRNISMATDEIGYVSSGGEIHKTSDGGVTWTIKGGFSEAAQVIAYGEQVAISQNTNRLVISVDGGETSEFISYDGFADIGLMNKGRFTEDGTLYLVGRAGTILKSTDFGFTHESFNTVDKGDITTLNFDNNGNGIATAGEGTVIITNDGGDSWAPVDYQSAVANDYIAGSAVLNDGSMLIGSESGITKFENGTFSIISEEEASGLLYSSEGEYLILVKFQGGDFIIKKSTDDGVTWENKGFMSDFGFHMHQSKSGNIYISGNDSDYSVSYDAGESWETVENPFGTFISSIYFLDDMNGLISTGNALHRTTDGGITWNQIYSAFAIFNLQMISENNYLLTTAQNSETRIFQTKDGGDSWTNIDTYCSSSRASTLVGDKYWLGQRGGHINFTQVDLSTSTEKVSIQDLSLKNNILRSTDQLIVDLLSIGTSKINITNQNGLTVSSHTVSQNGEYRLEMAELSVGIYFISVTSDQGIYQGRFVVIN